MWNPPTKKQLEKLPKLYSQEKVKDPLVRMKFFLGPMTWYITEYDGKDLMFGWVINDSFPEGNELGYVSFKELLGLKVRGMEVDRDLYDVTVYKPKKLSVIKREHMKRFAQ